MAKRTVTLSEEKLRNFISYSVAKLLREIKGLDDLGDFGDVKYNDDLTELPDLGDEIEIGPVDKPENKGITGHFPGLSHSDEHSDKGYSLKDDDREEISGPKSHFPDYESDEDDVAAVPNDGEQDECIRLSESNLKRIVAKAVRKRLNEMHR